MTAARRAAPEPPTTWQRLRAHLTRARRHDQLVSALEDHADRLDGYSRRASAYDDDLISTVYAACADDIRRMIEETQ